MSLRFIAAAITSIAVLGAPPVAAQQLRPILFTDWGRLCSIAVVDTVRVCLPETRELDDAVWSPDGKRIITGGGAILNDAGRRTGTLRNYAGIRPVWYPNGQYVFAIDYEVGSAVRRWDERGGSRKTIPVEGGEAAERRFQMLSFSPSGRRAALLTMQFREMVIADVEVNRLVVSRVAPVGFDYVSQAVWLNEDTVLFVGKRGSSPFGVLWRLSASTGAVDSVGIPGLALRDQIVVAPDRRSIVVTAASTHGETRWNLWYYDLSSGVARRLTAGTEDIVRSWR